MITNKITEVYKFKIINVVFQKYFLKKKITVNQYDQSSIDVSC